jgi:hypothetical protein
MFLLQLGPPGPESLAQNLGGMLGRVGEGVFLAFAALAGVRFEEVD